MPHSSHTRTINLCINAATLLQPRLCSRRRRANLWGTAEPALGAVVAPVQSIPALPHGGCDRLAPLACAMLMYNVVDSPVGVVPVTRVDAAPDQLSDEWRAAPGNESKHLENDVYGPEGVYDVQAMRGLPVGVYDITVSSHSRSCAQFESHTSHHQCSRWS